MLTTDAVFFAVRAALRLGEELRRGLVAAARRRALDLPVPPVTLDGAVAVQWFLGPGRAQVPPVGAVADLLEEATRGTAAARQAAASRLVPYYVEYWNADRVERGEAVLPLGKVELTGEEWLGLFRVRQLAHGDDRAADRSLLARVIGTVVEVGVDYLGSVAAARPDSRKGRIFGAVAAALDRIPFAELDVQKETWLRDIAGRFLVAALETVAEEPESVARDPRIRELVEVAAHGLVEDLGRSLDDGTFATLNAGDWAERIFRGLLKSAGEKVIAEPSRFLGVDDEGRGQVIRKVGGALLELVTKEDRLDLGRALSREGLETILRASLDLVASRPELFGAIENEGLASLVSSVAAAIRDLDLKDGADLLPEIVRIVLERSAADLDRIWPGLAKDPAGNLALTAIESALTALSRPPEPGARWQLRFERGDLLHLLANVVDDVATQPIWLERGREVLGADLGAVLGAVLTAIRERGDASLLSRESALSLLGHAVEAAVHRAEFLDRLPGGRPLVAEAVDIVLAALLDQDLDDGKRWRLLRDEALVEITVTVLDALEEGPIDPVALAQLKGVLNAFLADLDVAGPLDFLELSRRIEGGLSGGPTP